MITLSGSGINLARHLPGTAGCQDTWRWVLASAFHHQWRSWASPMAAPNFAHQCSAAGPGALHAAHHLGQRVGAGQHLRDREPQRSGPLLPPPRRLHAVPSAQLRLPPLHLPRRALPAPAAIQLGVHLPRRPPLLRHRAGLLLATGCQRRERRLLGLGQHG